MQGAFNAAAGQSLACHRYSASVLPFVLPDMSQFESFFYRDYHAEKQTSQQSLQFQLTDVI